MDLNLSLKSARKKNDVLMTLTFLLLGVSFLSLILSTTFAARSLIVLNQQSDTPPTGKLLNQESIEAAATLLQEKTVQFN